MSASAERIKWRLQNRRNGIYTFPAVAVIWLSEIRREEGKVTQSSKSYERGLCVVGGGRKVKGGGNERRRGEEADGLEEK